MSWQLGAMLFCGWLIAMYLILRLMDLAKRGDRNFEDWEDIYQWKLRRKREQDAARQRWGGK